MLTNLNMVIMSQYKYTKNRHIVHVNLTQCYMSIIFTIKLGRGKSVLRKKKIFKLAHCILSDSPTNKKEVVLFCPY